MAYGDCEWCGGLLASDGELFRGVCFECEEEREREEAEALEAEYEDAKWDLAKQYGYEVPW